MDDFIYIVTCIHQLTKLLTFIINQSLFNLPHLGYSNGKSVFIHTYLILVELSSAFIDVCLMSISCLTSQLGSHGNRLALLCKISRFSGLHYFRNNTIVYLNSPNSVNHDKFQKWYGYQENYLSGGKYYLSQQK